MNKIKYIEMKYSVATIRYFQKSFLLSKENDLSLVKHNKHDTKWNFQRTIPYMKVIYLDALNKTEIYHLYKGYTLEGGNLVSGVY